MENFNLISILEKSKINKEEFSAPIWPKEFVSLICIYTWEDRNNVLNDNIENFIKIKIMKEEDIDINAIRIKRAYRNITSKYLALFFYH